MVMQMIFYDANDTDDANNNNADNKEYDLKTDADNCLLKHKFNRCGALMFAMGTCLAT
jgi:hypothetical protein